VCCCYATACLQAADKSYALYRKIIGSKPNAKVGAEHTPCMQAAAATSWLRSPSAGARLAVSNCMIQSVLQLAGAEIIEAGIIGAFMLVSASFVPHMYFLRCV
jgi:hypothetical protein